MPIQIGQKLESDFNNPLGLLRDCHRRIERFLDMLIRVSDARDGAQMLPQQISAFEKALDYFHSAAPKHTADEEVSLFPRLRQVPGGLTALDCMAKLESDHQAADRDHEKVEAFGREWLEKGVLDPRRRREMKEALKRLSEMYGRHIEIEDRELFPLAARILPAEELAEVGREMAERRGAILRS